MDRSAPLSDILRDARLSAHAASARPAWLWSADGERILWANAVGAAIFGADCVDALAGKNFSGQQTASQVARLAANLRHETPPRLERLRGFGAGFGAALLCACSRITIGDEPAILIAAAAPAGPNLPFAERVRRIIPESEAPIAAFSADGELLHANAPAQSLLDENASLQAIRAEGATTEDIGAGNDAFVLATLSSGAGSVPPAITAETIDPSPAAETIDLSPVAEAMAEIQNSLGVAGTPEAAHKTEPSTAPDEESARETECPAPEQEQASAAPGQHEPAPQDNSHVPKQESEQHEPAMGERRHPVRFVWQMDADNRFSLGAGEFADVIGATVAAAFGRPWDEIVREFNLDPEGEVMRAIDSRDTWSGIVLQWPVEGSDERLPVELSGLPIYDRDRLFRGYRGFGVCRDIARIDALAGRRFGASAQLPNPSRSAENVVPFRNESRPEPAALTPVEHGAFKELASRLTERLQGADALASARATTSESEDMPVAGIPVSGDAGGRALAANLSPERDPLEDERPVLDRIPIGVLIYRHTQFIYANPEFLRWTGHNTLAEFAGAGGLDTLFIDMHEQSADGNDAAQSLRIANPDGQHKPVDARLLTIPFEHATAMALILSPPAAGPPDLKANDDAGDLFAMLDIATDASFTVEASGRILKASDGAARLFGSEDESLASRDLFDLFAPDSARTVRDCLEWLTRDGAPKSLSEGRDVIARRADGSMVPLFMTMGRTGNYSFAVMFRDMTSLKRAQEDLVSARRRSETAAVAKSDFLAKISHEIRTPLTAMIGFSDVMMNERFGPVGNERYKDYLRDIHGSGGQLIALLDDFIELSKIETGKLALDPQPLDLNEAAQDAVAAVQEQATRERIIIRQSLGMYLPQIVADAGSVKQILHNVVALALKVTNAAGQIIVSTAHADDGRIAFRVRSTGPAMSEAELETAFEPFRQSPAAGRFASGGAGLGLAVAKALVEANHATFAIQSTADTGTLIDIGFLPARKSA